VHKQLKMVTWAAYGEKDQTTGAYTPTLYKAWPGEICNLANWGDTSSETTSPCGAPQTDNTGYHCD